MKIINWPKYKNGKPKKFGDLTSEEKKTVLKKSLAKLKKELESPEFRKVMSEYDDRLVKIIK